MAEEKPDSNEPPPTVVVGTVVPPDVPNAVPAALPEPSAPAQIVMAALVENQLVICRNCSAAMPSTHIFCGTCGKHLQMIPPASEVPAGAQPAVTSKGGCWTEYVDIDMCGQGDVEIIPNWRSSESIAGLKRKVEDKGYSAFTVSNGHPSLGHAALKKFNFQLAPEHCRPISTCCRHPCKIYIYTPPPHLSHVARPVDSPPALLSTDDIQGCWTCMCIPGGCSCYKKKAEGQDQLLHYGLLFCCFVMPCPFMERRIRHAGSNKFYKEGEPGNVDVYATPSFTQNGISCSVKLC
eukprot:TRINITY_DN19360_c0_g4_i1.p1 TRINITY_DN19360_c0_g4~~TRINITY_DN19360_c0_g4_i1.p1  ORF type:complete len:293 (-),score=27.57 TRINITY_DN19360_c0_g4_i1:265-1143(-)